MSLGALDRKDSEVRRFDVTDSALPAYMIGPCSPGT
jgi:hypothetical protein